MKKLFLLFVLLSTNFTLFAANPDLNEVTFVSKYNETLDFYKNGMVVYKAKDAPFSRRGEYKVILGGAANVLGDNQKTIKVHIYIGEDIKTSSGVVNYKYATGYVNYIILDGEKWVRQ